MLKFCHDLYSGRNAHFAGGFNSAIYGDSILKAIEETRGEICAQRIKGWDAAFELIKSGKAFYKHHSGEVIKCFQDGDKWICVGDGFINLQESDNYAFGDDFYHAIEVYLSEKAQLKAKGE